MKFSRPDADVFVSDGISADVALARTTHLCVGAHQDDIEIMSYTGIAECYGSTAKFFTGVVVADGGGSPRTGRYTSKTDDEMKTIRREEQRQAAARGRYNLQLQLGHPSADIKNAAHVGVRSDLGAIFRACSPEVVYLHNPADKHDTHVAVFLRCIESLRTLPTTKRPKRVLGCEVWRDLDWLTESDRVALDAGQDPRLAAELLKVFDSQIAGGKRYDLATLGRRAANATFGSPHQADGPAAITWAMDLTPLVTDPKTSIRDFTLGYVDRLKVDIAERLSRLSGDGGL